VLEKPKLLICAIAYVEIVTVGVLHVGELASCEHWRSGISSCQTHSYQVVSKSVEKRTGARASVGSSIP
jgi:hypothetical protein